MSKTINIVVGDDHELFRDGLRAMLEKDGTIKVIGEASNGAELITCAEALKPHVVLVDIMMPEVDGVKAISILTKQEIPYKCLVLSTFSNSQMIVNALEAGALGYVVKNAAKGEIAEAIKKVHEGYPYYCRSTEMALTKLIAKSNFNPYDRINKPIFSEKEIEIIRYICEGKKSEEIGKLVHLGTRTVEGYRQKILEKMNVNTIAGVVIYAIKNYLYRID
ncbi:response regulator transcription factor [Panacibacter ginsenosidivorans]|uniref:Response regulator transcription factor n=1 Tax=Panacibacter ginsenosidivorans TaxID=1813871 RepID=A0A5B8VB76_9BACT|nr:response regulator transcription factor [Panacibacter ginsenosidivorans]QEC67916.1 response regulator transcription factor [Panacibacter ginsenosidivorans]